MLSLLILEINNIILCLWPGKYLWSQFPRLQKRRLRIIKTYVNILGFPSTASLLLRWSKEEKSLLMFNLANTLMVSLLDLAPFTLLALPGVGWFLPWIHSHRKKNYLLVVTDNNEVTPKQDEVKNFIKLLEIKWWLERDYARVSWIAATELWVLYYFISSSTFKKHKQGSVQSLFWEVSSSPDLDACSFFWNTAALFLMVRLWLFWTRKICCGYEVLDWRHRKLFNWMLQGMGPWCQGYLWPSWNTGKSGLGCNADHHLRVV